MFNSVFTSLSSMLTFQKALDIIGNNVGNMNTPGYKGRDMLFKDQMYQQQTGDREQGDGVEVGSGAQIDQTLVRYTQGEMRSSGVDTDMAIDGRGFFVLRNDEGTFYTRAGRFQFDKDGYLVDSVTKAKVAGLDNSGNVQDINVSGQLFYQPQASTSVEFQGVLDANLSVGNSFILPDNAANPDDAKTIVFDSLGASNELTITFTNNGLISGSTTTFGYTVEVKNASGTVLGTGEIRYDAGASVSGFDSVNITLSPTGGAASTISLDFSDTQRLSTATTTIKAKENGIDGFGVGNLTNIEFGEDGRLTFNYSNEQTREGNRVALALFQNEQSLIPTGDNLFKAAQGQIADIGAPDSAGLGKLKGGQIELSNVELSQEFTDIIIAQRGFQASSQLLSVSNEMIQQLFEMTGRS